MRGRALAALDLRGAQLLVVGPDGPASIGRIDGSLRHDHDRPVGATRNTAVAMRRPALGESSDDRAGLAAASLAPVRWAMGRGPHLRCPEGMQTAPPVAAGDAQQYGTADGVM